MRPCIIAGTKNVIWAINPENKQRMQVVRTSSLIESIYSDNNGIYHAQTNLQTKDNGEVPLYRKFIQVYDSISGNPAASVHLPEKRFLTLDELTKLREEEGQEGCVELFRKEDSLLYRLGDNEGVVFPRFKGVVQRATGKLSVTEGRVYFDGMKVIRLDDGITYLAEVDIEKLARIFRKKNKKRYSKNMGFFR